MGCVILGYINQNIDYKCEHKEFWNTHKSSDAIYFVKDWHVILIQQVETTSGMVACF